MIMSLIANVLLAGSSFDVPIETSGPTGGAPTSYVDVGRLFANLYTTLVIASGIATFIYLAVGGFQYITSSGDKIRLEEARNKITFSLLGLAIVVGAFAFAQIIKAVFGVSLIGAVRWPTP